MIQISFVDLQKISLFPKFWGCGSKIEPALPISTLNFSRVWQPFKVSYALQILVNDRSFIGHQMTFSSILLPLTGKQKFEINCLFLHRVSRIWYKKSWLWTIIYHMEDTLWKKRQFFSNFSFPITDTKNWWKYHLMTYKKSSIDQNLKGISVTPLRRLKLK